MLSFRTRHSLPHVEQRVNDGRWALLLFVLPGCIADLNVGEVGDSTSMGSSDDQMTAEDDDGSSEDDSLTSSSCDDCPETTNLPDVDSDTSTESNDDSSDENESTEQIACDAPAFPVSCDAHPDASHLGHILGIACNVDGAPVDDPELTIQAPFPTGYGVLIAHESALPTGFKPTDGEYLLALSTGVPDDLQSTPQGLLDDGLCENSRPHAADFASEIACPSSDIPDPSRTDLPLPLRFQAVDRNAITDCVDDPSLTGMGDCSNSMQKLTQNRFCWETIHGPDCALLSVHDIVRTTLSAQVPDGITALSFDFAFLSAEYPFTYQRPERFFTDAFVAWLESEHWTGNVAYDDDGNPITIENPLVHFRDTENEVDCPEPCVATELHGFAMEGHAASPWLTTSIPVVGGELIDLTFAIFELGAPYLDSIVLLDNLRWECIENLERPRTRLR